ncbi:MAG: sigma-54 dependent transcriptional regulator [Bacteroidales bacterium]|jgi:DNA-binding NtrC family response regulator|nr:sigma-54 dependent transcriptional regulator [Bacteroidales bacterium]
MKTGKILVADDNRNVLSALSLFLPVEFEHVKTIQQPGRLIAEMELMDYDVVLLDMNFTSGQQTGNEGIFWLREIKSKFPLVEVVMFTAYGDVELAVKALKEGASDFVIKPWDNEKLVASLHASCRISRSNRELTGMKKKDIQLSRELNRAGEVIFQSEAMGKVMKMVEKVAPTNANILITGENGTGKELIAREIHRLSDFASGYFILADLSALSESLFESELFGHARGAFTGAMEDRDGKFLMAQGGTLFLDEIGNLPLHLQAKLLTVLQTRSINPVGSNRTIPLNIRLVCATNKSIDQMVSTGKFREDLLYRINTIRIHMPALRERPEDIPLLVKYFLDFYTRKYNKPPVKPDGSLMQLLLKLPWQGNIRELRHAMEKIVILSDHGKPDPESYPGTGHLAMTDDTEAMTLEEMEEKMIRNALVKNRNNLTATAVSLGISRPTLYSKMSRYGI